MSLSDLIFWNAFHEKGIDIAAGVSDTYKHWVSEADERRCKICKEMTGKIWYLDELPDPEPPIHPNCRCDIQKMETILAGTATANKHDGADWMLKYKGELPEYYIEYDDIKALGWRKGKIPSNFAPGKMYTGGIYRNDNKHLPDKSGRIWHEADINYEQGETRNSQRIVWSDDGLIFVTYDHYETFNEII